MTIGDALSIRVALDGVDSVLRGLHSIESGISSAAGQAKLLTGIGSGFIAAGVATAMTANTAYESIEKMRRSFAAFAGESKGNALAKWMAKFSVDANTSAEALRQAGMNWLSYTSDTGRFKALETGLEKFGGTGKEGWQVSSVATVLGQIMQAGRLKGNDPNQLASYGLPIKAVLKQLGLKSLDQARGMESSKFVDAVIKQLNALPSYKPLGTQAAQNALENFQLSLAPTGRLMQNSLVGAANAAGLVGTQFGKLNDITGGAAGLILIVGLTVVGFRLLRKAIAWPVVPLNRLTIAANEAAAALTGLAAKAAGGGVAGAAGAAAGGAGIVPYAGGAAAGVGAAANKTVMYRIGVAVGKFRAVVLANLAGWVIRGIVAASAFVVGLLGGIVAGEGLARLFGLKPKKSSVQLGQDAAKRWADGDPNWWMMENDARRKKAIPATPAAERKQRRNSAEGMLAANLSPLMRR